MITGAIQCLNHCDGLICQSLQKHTVGPKWISMLLESCTWWPSSGNFRSRLPMTEAIHPFTKNLIETTK